MLRPDARTATALLVAGTFFMENLDATVILPALPQMALSFAVDPVDLNIGVSAYVLTLGLFIPASGWIAERFGSRRVFAGAIVLFTLASLLCGLAESLSQFVAMRVLQGVGGALMVPVGRLVVLSVMPKDRLIGAIATLTWPALVAPVLGPPLGGLVADQADWRWIFYLNLPLGLIAFALALRLLPKSAGEKGRPFDWPGFLTMGGGLFCLLLVTELLARPVIDWGTTGAAAIIGTGILLAGARHLRHAAAPIFDLGALRVPTFAVAIQGGSIFRMGISAVPFLLPLMFQLGFGLGAAEAGAMLTAVFAGNLLMKPLTSPVLRRFGFRRVLVVNGLLNAACIAACAAFTPSLSLWLVGGVLFLGGMSRSMQFTALNTISFADIPQPAMAGANTLFSTAFQLTTGLGIALGAIAWRIGETVTASSEPDAPFRIAFLLVAAVSLGGVWDSLKLQPGAGGQVLRRG